MDYYSKKLFLAKVDHKDNILGKVERWEAHKKGILHRGFTVILFYNNQIVLQHRKHPAFDGYWDLTFSSHQIYKTKSLQTDLEAIYETLRREWNVEKDGLKDEPNFLGKIYYKARDPNSIYIEHEIDYIYSAELKNKPYPNPDYAYGFKLVDNPLNAKSYMLNAIKLCPWVAKIISKHLI